MGALGIGGSERCSADIRAGQRSLSSYVQFILALYGHSTAWRSGPERAAYIKIFFFFFLVLFGFFVWRRRNGGACVLFSTQDVQLLGG